MCLAPIAVPKGSLKSSTRGLEIDDPLAFGLKVWESETLSILDVLVNPNLMHLFRNHLR